MEKYKYLKYNEVKVGNSVVLEYGKGNVKGEFSLHIIRGKVLDKTEKNIRIIGFGEVDGKLSKDIGVIKLHSEVDKFRIRQGRLPKEISTMLDGRIKKEESEGLDFKLDDEVIFKLQDIGKTRKKFDTTTLQDTGRAYGIRRKDADVNFTLIIRGNELDLRTYRTSKVGFDEIEHGQVKYESDFNEYYYSPEGKQEDITEQNKPRVRYAELGENKEVDENEIKDFINIFNDKYKPIQEFDKLIKDLGLEYKVYYNTETYNEIKNAQYFSKFDIRVVFKIINKKQFRGHLKTFSMLLYEIHS